MTSKILRNEHQKVIVPFKKLHIRIRAMKNTPYSHANVCEIFPQQYFKLNITLIEVNTLKR